MKSAFIYSSKFFSMELHPFYPLKTSRVSKVLSNIKLKKIFTNNSKLIDVECDIPIYSKLLNYHKKEYIDVLMKANDGELDYNYIKNYNLGTLDTPVFKGVYDFAVEVVKQTLCGVSLIIKNLFDYVFVPAGGFHHARSDMAEGFCYLNDNVLAIQDLVNSNFKVCYIDIDAHHADGVQEAFYNTDKVLTISIHESGETLFPWSGFVDEMGEGDGKGYNINVPLPAQSDDEIMNEVVDEIVLPAINLYNPDIVVMELGVDTNVRDNKSNLMMTNNVIIDTLKKILNLKNKGFFLGGGGYDEETVVKTWVLCWAEICGYEVSNDLILTLGGDFIGNIEGDLSFFYDKPFKMTGLLKEKIKKKVQKIINFIKDNHFKLIK